MDVLKLIPQMFFDLIGRLVPGGFALVAGHLHFGVNPPRIGIETASKLLGIRSQSAALEITAFLAGAYVVGHLLAPLSRLMEFLVGLLPFDDCRHPLAKFYDGEKSDVTGVAKFVKSELGDKKPNTREMDNAVYLWYDWLRIHKPDVGAFAAKLRAECRMYGALASIFALSLIVQIVLYGGAFAISPGRYGKLPTVPILLVTIVCLILLLIRTARGRRIFRLSVTNFYYAAKRKDDIVIRPGDPANTW